MTENITGLIGEIILIISGIVAGWNLCKVFKEKNNIKENIETESNNFLIEQNKTIMEQNTQIKEQNDKIIFLLKEICDRLEYINKK